MPQVGVLLFPSGGGLLLLLVEEPLDHLTLEKVPAHDLGHVLGPHGAVDDAVRIHDDVGPVGAQPETDALRFLDRARNPLADELLAELLTDPGRVALPAAPRPRADEHVVGVGEVHSTSRTAWISRQAFCGSSSTPCARRVCLPRSPRALTNTSEAPSMTLKA